MSVLWNHRMTEVGRGIWMYLVQTPCLCRGQLEQVIQSFKYQVSNIFKDRDTTTFPGNLVRCLTTLIVTSVLTLKWNLLYFCLCLMLLLPLGATEESASLFFTSSHHMFIPYSWRAFFCNLGWHQSI